MVAPRDFRAHAASLDRGGEMSIWDTIDSAVQIGETGLTGAEMLLKSAGKEMPGISEGISVGEALFQGGEAVYDGTHGDRNGAVNHGTQAVVDAACALPGVSELSGLYNLGMQLTGHESLAEQAGGAAVSATNSIFGASTTTPTGTRSGELAAGITSVAPFALCPALLPMAVANMVTAGNDQPGTVQNLVKQGVEKVDPSTARPYDGLY
jgi:hypothetical protein